MYEKYLWKDVLQIYNGKNQSKVVDENGVYPIYGSGGVMGFAKEFICPGGTVIIGRKGSINNPIFVDKPFWNVDTAFGLVTQEKLFNKYLYYFCVKYDFYKHNKAVTIPSLTKSDLLNIEIPLPPLATQKAIAEKLDKADALRKKDQELLKQYDELAQSIFIEMFGDPVQNEKGWDLINFEEVLKLKRGYDLPVQDRNQNGNIPVYGSNGILDYHTISKTNKPCIVTGRSGTIGKVHRTEQNCWPLNTTLYSYEIYDNNITYLEYLLNNLRIDRFAHGAGVPTLDRKIVHKEFIPNIKVELQNQFAEKIKNIEAQKELVKKQAEASENLFQALLQESFSFT
ncbi:restriction endonuclease subunit S [Empedobacter sp. R132-2]|uniref:restriction endonuclease subunit S n=1 Tax=Empedobacter sp. R132-2 TaxID=2746740 RepID=UPI0025761C2E|nr:restriction endonuclease subunit S [Empedobacter sp. R132-2]MDM1138398.1 restriction endonuclease subunit S [Empedobacter sp. R132-2]